MLALGIALLISATLIVFSMHDADANPDAGRALRIRDAPSAAAATLTNRAELNAKPVTAESKRTTLQNQR